MIIVFKKRRYHLRPEYSELAAEMIEYAENAMPNSDNKRRFVLFGFQEVFINKLKKRDYEKIDEYGNTAFDFINELAYELPEFFYFADTSEDKSPRRRAYDRRCKRVL